MMMFSLIPPKYEELWLLYFVSLTTLEINILAEAVPI
jgi:hypothetical protein